MASRPTTGAAYGLVDQMRPGFPDVRSEIVRPDRVAVVSRYLLERWAPKLGANATLTLLALRRRCYAKTDTGEIRNTCFPRVADLAAEIGIDRTTVMRALRKLEQLGFVARERRYRLSEKSLGVSRSTDLYTVLMFEPITPEDEGRAAVLEAERIAGDGRPVTPDSAYESHSATDGGGNGGGIAQPNPSHSDTDSTPRSARRAPLSVAKCDQSSGRILRPQKIVPGEALETPFERSKGASSSNRARTRDPGSGPMDDPRIACLVQDAEQLLSDTDSRGFMIRIATLLPEDAVRTAMAETREASRDGRIRGSMAAYFTGVVKRQAEALGVSLRGRPR